jgi:hypothetical protein
MRGDVHFEFLVEDQSGKKALEVLVPSILGPRHTFAIHSYKGIGRIPKDMKDAADPAKRILLTNLPKLLKGYGRTFAGYQLYKAAVVLVCDLDNRNLKTFLGELQEILKACHPKPETRFCIAIEEGEAWFLGDMPAVKSAYPNADLKVLQGYKNDSICGTWEILADAIYPGGSKKLIAKGWQAVGAEKFRWAERIAPQMHIDVNESPSFCFFRSEIRVLCQSGNEHCSDALPD